MCYDLAIPTPTIVYDFEFAFMHGGPSLFITAEDGRDRITIDDLRVLIQVKPDDGSVEETIVHRGALAFMRTTRREVAESEDEIQARIAEGVVTSAQPS